MLKALLFLRAGGLFRDLKVKRRNRYLSGVVEAWSEQARGCDKSLHLALNYKGGQGGVYSIQIQHQETKIR